MRKSIATILMSFLGIALLFYTATRTIDLVGLTLPADSKVLGYLAVAALDGGLIVWLLCFRYGARGHWQRGISAMMIVVCLVGIGGTTAADTLLNASKNKAISAQNPDNLLAIILVITTIIILNVAAAAAMHLLDPEALHASAEEEAKSNITAETLKHINANSHSLAAELAPALAARWMDDMRAQHLGITAAPRYSAHVIEQPLRELPTAEPTRRAAAPTETYTNETPIITPPPARAVSNDGGTSPNS